MSHIRLTLLTSFFILIFACSKDKKVSGITCDGSNLAYNTGVSDIINSNCNSSGCHNSGSQHGSFTSFSGLQGVIASGAFNSQVLIDQAMPQGSATLTKSQLDKLKCWVDNGYPEN